MKIFSTDLAIVFVDFSQILRSTGAYLNADVVVLLLGHLDEDGEEGEDGLGAEEGALRPDHGQGQDPQDQGHQPAEASSQHTLPVPLCC